MMLYILLGVTAVVLIGAPVFLAVKFGKLWNLDGKIFWKAAFAFLIIQIFLSTIISNSTLIFLKGPISAIDILLYAVISALTLELGKFLILDKIMKYVRSFLKGVYFGLGWGGVVTILLGFATAFSIFGIDLLMKTEDLSTLVPANSGVTVEDLANLKEQMIPALFNYPYFALLPIVERASWLLIDVALTVLILFGISSGESRYIWGAVLMRTALIFSTVYLSSFAQVYLIQSLLFVAFGVASYFIIRKMDKLFNERGIA